MYIYFGADKKLSQNVLSELLHNLSYQALDLDNKKVNIKFNEIVELTKDLKRLIRDVDRSNIETITFEDIVDDTKDKVETMEQEVVDNILTNKKIDFPSDFKPPMPSSVNQIKDDIEKVNTMKRKTDESLNEVFEEVTKDVTIQI